MLIEKVVAALRLSRAHTATKYVAENHVIRATAVLYGGRLRSKRSNEEIVLTIGRPNYRERRFIRACKKAGEPFPVRKIQLKFPPVKRAA